MSEKYAFWVTLCTPGSVYSDTPKLQNQVYIYKIDIIYLQIHQKMSLIKVAWCMLRVKKYAFLDTLRPLRSMRQSRGAYIRF